MRRPAEILVLDDEEIVCARLREHLDPKEFLVETFTQSKAAIARLGEKSFDVVVTDLKMEDPGGLEVMHFVRNNSPGTQVIIITGYGSIEAAREAEFSGVFAFITKPFHLKEITATIRKAAKKGMRRTPQPS